MGDAQLRIMQAQPAKIAAAVGNDVVRSLKITGRWHYRGRPRYTR